MLTGPVNDEGYYQVVHEGLIAATDAAGAQLNLVENVAFDVQAQIDTLRNLAQEGNQLIVVDGAEGDAAAAVAPQFPDIEFVIYTAPAPEELPNLHAYLPQQGLTSFQLGTLAASLSQSGKLACLAGYDDSPSGQGCGGFELGVLTANPDAEFTTTVVGSYSDAAAAKQAASAQIANGVDVIYVYVDSGFPGVVQTVEESGEDVLLFHQTVLRCELSDTLVGSSVIGTEAMQGSIVQDFLNDSLAEGTLFIGLEDAAIQRAELCPAHDTPANQDILDVAADAILNGDVELPPEVTGQ